MHHEVPRWVVMRQRCLVWCCRSRRRVLLLQHTSAAHQVRPLPLVGSVQLQSFRSCLQLGHGLHQPPVSGLLLPLKTGVRVLADSGYQFRLRVLSNFRPTGVAVLCGFCLAPRRARWRDGFF